jgi:hypothetical protein
MLRAVHIVFALLCAAAMSQFPAFHQQYLQRLGGTLDELNRQIDGLDQRAAEQGMDRFDYIRRFQANEDSLVRGEGDAMLATVARRERVAEALKRLRDAPWYMMLVEVAFHLEPDVAANTAKDFVPAVPLSLAGGAHAFLGLLIGWLLPPTVRSFFPRRVLKSA